MLQPLPVDGRTTAVQFSTARFERELDRVHAQYDAEIRRLIDTQQATTHAQTLAFQTERESLHEQIRLLRDILNPQIAPAGPQSFEASEEAEHLAFSKSAGSLDPHLVAALDEVGLDPAMHIEPGTD